MNECHPPPTSAKKLGSAAAASTGVCECAQNIGIICAHCEQFAKAIAAGGDCFGNNIATGGKACRRTNWGADCSNGGGSCDMDIPGDNENGHCKCYQGIYCEDCSLNVKELRAGQRCATATASAEESFRAKMRATIN
jgi:hypothetical protein